MTHEEMLDPQDWRRCAPSATGGAPSTIGGRTYLRVAVANHRSRREDFDLPVREVVRLGAELTRG